MLISFTCPHCSSRLEVEGEAAETNVACPACQSLVTVPRKILGPGITLDGFEIKRLLGQGAMGVVYLARQLSLDRDVALKILPSHLMLNPKLIERFRNEVRLAAKLEHPHIVTAYEAGSDEGLYYMAMAYVKGETLTQHLKKHGALSERRALDITRRIAEALDYAWREHRLLHRDIKPDNIMLDQYGQPRLMDMGLSKSLLESQGLTVKRTVMGSPNYMSPEQSAGVKGLDFRSDMYALGATLYHMITGHMPFEGDSLVGAMHKQLSSPLPDPRDLNPEISNRCVELMAVMLSKHPDQRHQRWSALIEDIDRVMRGHRPRRRPAGKNSTNLPVSLPRIPAAVIRIMIALILFLLILSLLLRHRASINAPAMDTRPHTATRKHPSPRPGYAE